MSALGHKQTCAVHKGMSALAPKADIRSATASKGMTFVSPQPARPVDQGAHQTDHRSTAWTWPQSSHRKMSLPSREPTSSQRIVPDRR